MAKKILIKTKIMSMEAELNETELADKIYRALPIKSAVHTWGDEIYFNIPVQAENENPVSSVNEGDIAFWPPQSCFCMFFGLTPVSSPGEIKPASEVTVLGKMIGNPKEWQKVSDGQEIILEKI